MIEIKTAQQIEKIRAVSKIVIEAIKRLRDRARAGVQTKDLDRMAAEMIMAERARPAFLGYRGFPKSICTSINEEIVHGIPDERVLVEGDILSIDVGVEMGGYFSDAAITVGIGKISPQARRLIEVTRKALLTAIDAMRAGNRVSDISAAIQEYVEGEGFSVIREFVGHGIGSSLHEDPQIPNFGHRGAGIRIKEGMVFALEPMVSAGRWEAEILEDGWTAVTKDRSLAAHFEHTVAVTDKGTEVLTEGII